MAEKIVPFLVKINIPKGKSPYPSEWGMEAIAKITRKTEESYRGVLIRVFNTTNPIWEDGFEMELPENCWEFEVTPEEYPEYFI